MINTTLAILAGGAGSRMGRPKGELRLTGKPILQYLLDRFDWPGPTLLVTAPGREHPPACERFSREVVDPVSGEGPLRGILTVLESATTAHVIVASVDMPLVERSQLDWLCTHIEASLGLMTSHENQIEPFPSIFSKRAIDVIAQQLMAGKRGVHQLIAMESFACIPAPPDWDGRCWTNLNTPKDLASIMTSTAKP